MKHRDLWWSQCLNGLADDNGMDSDMTSWPCLEKENAKNQKVPWLKNQIVNPWIMHPINCTGIITCFFVSAYKDKEHYSFHFIFFFDPENVIQENDEFISFRTRWIGEDNRKSVFSCNELIHCNGLYKMTPKLAYKE